MEPVRPADIAEAVPFGGHLSVGIAPGGADLLTGMALQSKGKETGRPPPAGGIAGQEISCTGTVQELAAPRFMGSGS